MASTVLQGHFYYFVISDLNIFEFTTFDEKILKYGWIWNRDGGSWNSFNLVVTTKPQRKIYQE